MRKPPQNQQLVPNTKDNSLSDWKVKYRVITHLDGTIDKCRLRPKEDIFHIRSGNPATECSIRTQSKVIRTHIPKFGRGGSDLRQFVNQTAGQLANARKEFLPKLKEIYRKHTLMRVLQSSVIGTIFEVTKVPAMLLSYLAIHRSGFAVICKKPPIFLLRTLMSILLHVHSTFLTPNGMFRFYTRISESGLLLDNCLGL